MTKITLYWFRRDLRLEDNAGFYRALKSEQNVQPIFILDTEILDKLEDKDDRRVSFIHNRIINLDESLKKLGARLWVFHGKPVEVFSSLIKEHSISALYANRDYEPYARKRDKTIYELLAQENIPFKAFKDHVIFEKNEVVKDNGDPYLVYTPYARKWKEAVTSYHLKSYPSELYLNQLHKSKQSIIPSLKSMGFQTHEADWPQADVDLSVVKNYHNTRNLPAINGTTRISVHLRFGTVSIREMARIGHKHNTKWFNELIWRDFYQSILWHFPQVVNESFRIEYDRIEWRNNEEEFNAWCQGNTGYPIVDAGMRELNETGLMHNRVRMIVASFLTKHLLIDWRWGEAYFARKLLDFELASNNGGWQWAAGSGVDAAPYFRVFNPYLQTEKFDPKKAYIKKWVNDLESKTYPQPIVDHKQARLRALATYKKGLAKG
ncbi:MAG: deoxyribodipyrimidine photo-lyase [Salibacteraceae bacterium]